MLNFLLEFTSQSYEIGFIFPRCFFKGSSPEALQLAQEVGKRLEYLQMLVDDAIAKEAASGKKLPAPTVMARVEQALNWVDDPTGQKSSVGM